MKKKKKRNTLANEKFESVGTSSLDSRNRVTLKEKIMKRPPLNHMEVDTFKIFLGDEGDILLRPMAKISSRELWLYQSPGALRDLKKGLKDAKAGKITKVKNLKKFLHNL